MLGVAAFAIFLDQFTKALVIENFQPGVLSPMLGDVVQFNLVFNDSAAFSMGFGATWLLTTISSIAALAVIWYGKSVETKSWALIFGLALGGITGNLIDRLTRAPGFGIGEVVDFIQIPFNFPVFNIADSCIVIVACVTVIRIMRGDKVGKAKSHG
jgi:signal peptidase II